MQIKRFFAEDTHTALGMVREAMGSDAVIIANREVDDGVEVIASGDYDEAGYEQVAVQLSEAASGNAEANDGQQLAIDEMRNEISQLRHLLEGQLSNMQLAGWNRQKDVRADIYQQLSEHLGIGDEFASKLAASCAKNTPESETTEQALKALTEALPVLDDNTLDEGGIIVLHGPTGAGKTTTIAKLAARFSQLHGADGILMISADNRRIGAHEQLLSLGKLLAIPVLHARSNQELNAMLSALGDKKLVLVDSSGLVQSDLRNPQELAAMQIHEPVIRHYLILPAIMQPYALDKVLDSMDGLDFRGCIISKVDEAISLGELLTSIHKAGLPIAFWTDGQHIHEHLHLAKAADLVAQAVLIAWNQKEMDSQPSPVQGAIPDKKPASLRH